MHKDEITGNSITMLSLHTTHTYSCVDGIIATLVVLSACLCITPYTICNTYMLSYALRVGYYLYYVLVQLV